MAFFAAGFGLLLHVLFWGAGLALILTPRQWKVAWPALCAPAGLALQSAVVWLGALTPLAGTRVYGMGCEVIPVALLGVGLWRAWGRQRRNVWSELRVWQGVGFLTVLTLNALLIPLAVASKNLTSSSLGSCDAADYAAGARVLMEFSRYDRSGFIGLTEVVQLHSVDNFFDHWIRLNHFTPSAVIALNGTILGYQPYEIVSVTAAVFVALSLGIVFWFARGTFRFGRVCSGWICALYGCSPILWYAVYQVAMSQILAAIAIALLNAAAIAMWSATREERRWWIWSGVLAIAYALILGAYNFIVIVCLAPAVGYVGLQVCASGEWRRLFRWLGWVLVPLAAMAVLFLQRTLGLIERFTLFQEYDFGWKIPALTPEGWWGMVARTDLSPLPPNLRWPLLALTVVLLAWGFFQRGAIGRRRRWLAVGVIVPVTLGYVFLEARGAWRGTNASYDAYKLLSVFYPALLPAVGLWLPLAARGTWLRRGVLVAFAATALVFNAHVAYRFTRRMEAPPLIVGRSLVDLQRLENVPEITSLNMLIDDFWSRLWANSFLLRKAQYFPSYTYEGRRNTALKGDVDLHGGILRFHTPGEHDEMRLTPPYSLLDTRSDYFLRGEMDEGWFEPESLTRVESHWRWTKGNATIRFENPHAKAMPIQLRIFVRALLPRDLEVAVNGKVVDTSWVDADLRPAATVRFELPPGKSIVELRSNIPATSPGPADERKLGFAVYGIDVDVLKDLRDPPIRRPFRRRVISYRGPAH